MNVVRKSKIEKQPKGVEIRHFFFCWEGGNWKLKKLKRVIALLLVGALLLSVLCGFASNSTDESDLYQRMQEACQEGNDMEEWVVEGRKQIAEELGLTEHLDEKSYLSLDYRNESQIGKSGVGEDEKLDLLIERSSEEETQFMLMRHMIQPFSSSIYHGATLSVVQERSPGNNSIFSVSGAASYGYCAQNGKSYWNYGQSKSGTAYEWDDAIVRKVLYYSPGGPGYTGPYTLSGKTSVGNDADHAGFTTGYQNGMSNNNTKARAYISFLSSKADPISLGYKAYKIDIPEPYQDVAILNYTPPAPVNGTLHIIKYSTDSEITNNSSCYSLAGAVYGVYVADGDYSKPEYTVTLKEYSDGWSPTGLASGVKYGWASISVPPGNYWVKEITAPKGFALSTDWYPSYDTSIAVSSGGTVYVKTYNKPQLDPIGILLGKVDSETNANKPQGSASLQGAEFTIKYYAVNSSTDPALNGTKPVRTWVFRTNENGMCYFSKEFFVSGDAFYLTSAGVPSMPLGTITIQETKAPEGYLINPEVFVRQITSDGYAENVTTYNQPIIKEKILELSLLKVNEDGDVLAGAEFTHTKPDGSVEIFTTDEDGVLRVKGLEYGTHKIQESKSPEGYRLDLAVMEFTVKTDNTITDITITRNGESVTDSYEYEITEEGNIAVTVVNQRGLKLPATGSAQTLLFSMTGGLCCFIGIYEKSKRMKRER